MARKRTKKLSALHPTQIALNAVRARIAAIRKDWHFDAIPSSDGAKHAHRCTLFDGEAVHVMSFNGVILMRDKSGLVFSHRSIDFLNSYSGNDAQRRVVVRFMDRTWPEFTAARRDLRAAEEQEIALERELHLREEARALGYAVTPLSLMPKTKQTIG